MVQCIESHKSLELDPSFSLDSDDAINLHLKTFKWPRDQISCTP